LPRLAGWLALATFVVLLDQASKAWVLASFRYMESVERDLVLQPRAGLQLGRGLQLPGRRRRLAEVVLRCPRAGHFGLAAEHAAPPRAGAPAAASLSLILGGAIGNVIDRLRFDVVVDFLDFHLAGYHWPAFNVADSAITVGVVLMLWHQFRYGKETETGTQ
jgi:signal peptidase II